MSNNTRLSSLEKLASRLLDRQKLIFVLDSDYPGVYRRPTDDSTYTRSDIDTLEARGAEVLIIRIDRTDMPLPTA